MNQTNTQKLNNIFFILRDKIQRIEDDREFLNLEVEINFKNGTIAETIKITPSQSLKI